LEGVVKLSRNGNSSLFKNNGLGERKKSQKVVKVKGGGGGYQKARGGAFFGGIFFLGGNYGRGLVGLQKRSEKKNYERCRCAR